MQLSDAQLESFKEVYKRKFGIDLTNKEAYEKASRLLQYVMLCVKPREAVQKKYDYSTEVTD